MSNVVLVTVLADALSPKEVTSWVLIRTVPWLGAIDGVQTFCQDTLLILVGPVTWATLTPTVLVSCEILFWVLHSGSHGRGWNWGNNFNWLGWHDGQLGSITSIGNADRMGNVGTLCAGDARFAQVLESKSQISLSDLGAKNYFFTKTLYLAGEAAHVRTDGHKVSTGTLATIAL